MISCIIPARYSSTRLPGKPLLEINGLPLVMWVYRCAQAAGVFGRIVVATDDARIVDAVERHGGEAVMTAEEHRSGTDRVFEAAKKLECAYVVNLQGDEPRIPPDLLTSFAGLTSRLDDNTLLTVASHATIEGIADPNVVKVVLDDRGRALYFSRSAIPYDRDGSGPATFLKHVGIYGFSRESLQRYCSFPEGTLERIEKLEQLRALEQGMLINCLVHEFEPAGIDTPEDLAAFRASVT